VKHKAHQVQRKQTDVQNVHLVDKCVGDGYFSYFKPVLLQQKSQLCDVRGLPLPIIDDQANHFVAKFSTIFLISLHFQFLSRNSRIRRRAPQSFDSRNFLIKSFCSYHFEKLTGYSLNFM